MPISSENLPVVAFLIEIYLECLDAERAIKELRHGARHWRLMKRGKDFDRQFSPGEIRAWATACLGSFNRMRLMLEPGTRQKPKVRRRCEVLQQLLGYPRFKHIFSPGVRHAWEHLDERLDRVVLTPAIKAFSHDSVMADRPSADTLIFRRFDPVKLSIQVLGQEIIELRPCLQEVRILKTAAEAANDSLHDGRVVSFTAAQGSAIARSGGLGKRRG